MTRADKKINKEHCKNARPSVKLQCWYFRNETEIKTVLLTAITSLAVQWIITASLTLLALGLGEDVSS